MVSRSTHSNIDIDDRAMCDLSNDESKAEVAALIRQQKKEVMAKKVAADAASAEIERAQEEELLGELLA